MWISRKKHKKELDQMKSKYEQELKDIKKHIFTLESELNNKIQAYNQEQLRSSELRVSNNGLVEQNGNLIDWIKKICTETGTYKINDKRSVTIPMHVNERIAYNECIGPESPTIKQEIHIPELRFILFGKREDKI